MAVLCIVAPAHAEDVNAAREHYRKGTTLFDLQKFGEAAHEYELAYEAKDDPALLFNIAQSYRLAGDSQRALGAYKAYLRRVPHPSNSDEVYKRIAELQKLVDQQKRTQEAPPMGTLPVETKGATEPTTPAQPTTPPTTPAQPATPQVAPAPAPVITTTTSPAADARSGRIKQIAGIGTAGLGVACLAVGVAMVVVAKNTSNDITNAPPNTVFSPSKESAVKTDSAVGVTMLVVGGVAAATGATLFVLGRRESQRARRMALVPAVGRGSAGVALFGHF
jgi:hypothetical protein